MLATAPASSASIRFDNVADALTRATSLPAFGNLTWMFWMYRPADLNLPYESMSYISSSSAFTGTFLGLAFIDSADELCVDMSITGGSGGCGGSDMLPVQWWHLALVFDDTANTINVYLNGVNEPVLARTGVTGTATWAFEVLGTKAVGSAQNFDGRIAGYKQFTAALTAAEIVREMRYWVPVRRANLYSYSPLRTITELTSFVGGANWTSNGTLTTEADPVLPGGFSPGNGFLAW
jgi:hypothetical protein